MQWTVNEWTELSNGTDRVEMTQRRETVDGQLQTLHTLIIRDATAMDIGSYQCHFGSASDEVDVKIVRPASRYCTQL